MLPMRAVSQVLSKLDKHRLQEGTDAALLMGAPDASESAFHMSALLALPYLCALRYSRRPTMNGSALQSPPPMLLLVLTLLAPLPLLLVLTLLVPPPLPLLLRLTVMLLLPPVAAGAPSSALAVAAAASSPACPAPPAAAIRCDAAVPESGAASCPGIVVVLLLANCSRLLLPAQPAAELRPPHLPLRVRLTPAAEPGS